MYRLLFKVRSVHLRIREEVQVQVVIKKEHQNFIIPYKAKLINGTAIFQSHSQFFLSEKNPIFDLYVMILHGPIKKFAGMCEINLNEWQQNSNNETTSLLLKSPDTTATIVFNFMYLTCDVQTGTKNLISVGQLESLKKSEYIKEMQDKYSYLTSQNNRLSKQVASLKQEKRVLIENREEMESEYSRTSESYQKKIKNTEIERQNSVSDLVKMKETMQKIERLVNEYGEGVLKQKIGDIFHSLANGNNN